MLSSPHDISTMFMMTTEKEGGCDQRTRDSYFTFNPHQNPDNNHQSKSLNFEQFDSQNSYTFTKPMIENYGKLSLPTEKTLFHHHHQDEGYSTDSKSNTSPNTIPSPLSSSFSSMSTFDGSYHSPTSPSGGGVPSPNTYYHTNHSGHSAMHGNPQRNPAPPQKLSLIQGNGKIHVNRHALVMAKKKDAPQDMQDNSCINLEDRLRELTTIEEEEPSQSNTFVKETYKKEFYTAPIITEDQFNHNQSIPNHGVRIEDGRSPNQDPNSGFFRAVPVEISSPQHLPDQRSHVGNRNDNFSSVRSTNSDIPVSVSATTGQNANDKNWFDYRTYFEKDCNIPLRNIDALNRGKFINAGSENANKDINRQLGTNTPEVPVTVSGQIRANVTNSRQPGVGMEQIQVQPQNSYDIGVGVQERQRQHFNTTQSQSQFQAYPENDNQQWNQEQNTLLSSMPDLRFPSYSTQSSSQIRDEDPYHPENQPRFHPEQSNSLPQSHHHQQQQHTNQPTNHSQNQYFRQSPFYEERTQETHDPRLSNAHDRSSGSYNSLPRHFEDQRQQPSLYSQPQRDSSQFSEEDVVLRRSWASSSTRAIPDRVERYSWQPGSRSQLSNSTNADRYSLDLGNIPQLQQQIRATSEMCLQASKRHKFASSADIYKLFQGQKKPSTQPPSSSSSSTNAKEFLRNQNQSHRHSFHALPGGGLMTRSQQNIHNDQQQLPLSRDSITPSAKQHGVFSTNPSHPPHRAPPPSPGPLRGDHSIPLPHTSWANSNNNNTFLHPASSNSTLSLPLSELPHIQRQSSGYSSENELQQIELNAKATKRSKNRSNSHSVQGGMNSEQEFVPVDPTQDPDSSSSMIENEPVYVNQTMLANARVRGSASSFNNKSSPIQTTPPPPALPPRPQKFPSSTVNKDFHHLQRNVSDPNTNSAHQNVQNVNANVDNHNNFVIRTDRNSPNQAAITQKQVINFSQKPVTISSHIPNHPYITHTNTNIPHTNGPDIESRPQGQLPSLRQLDFQSNQDKFLMEQKPSSNGDYLLNPPKRSNSSRSNRSNSSPCTPLSPLEIAQVLEVPFATNVISDECGDRLSTLV